jgi:hypothetical protein
MRTAITLEAEWRQVLRGSMGEGTKEDESSTGRIWAAGSHHGTACSHLACISKLVNHLFVKFSKIFRATVGTVSADTGA